MKYGRIHTYAIASDVAAFATTKADLRVVPLACDTVGPLALKTGQRQPAVTRVDVFQRR